MAFFSRRKEKRKEQDKEVIYSGGLFCVISAYKPGDSEEAYNENHNQLQEEILRMKYSYLEMSFAYSYSDGNGMTSVKRDSLFVPKVLKHEEKSRARGEIQAGNRCFRSAKEIEA